MLDSLRQQAPNQYTTFQHNVADVLTRRGLPVESGAHGGPSGLRRVDERRFRELTWQLINQGILVQGLDSNNAQWPWLSLTEWGAEYATAAGADVYDPDGYLRDLESDRPLDEIEKATISAIRRIHCHRPTTLSIIRRLVSLGDNAGGCVAGPR